MGSSARGTPEPPYARPAAPSLGAGETSRWNPPPLGHGRLRKLAISLFVVLHWTCALPWVVPGLWNLRSITDAYLYATGQWQAWFMFADPPRSVSVLAADVHYAEGGSERWSFPRLAELGFWRAWMDYRQREYENRLLAGQLLFFARPERARDDLCRYVARQMHQPGRTPVRVDLLRGSTPIPPPDRSGSGWIDFTARLRDPAAYRYETFHTCRLDHLDGGGPR